MEVRKDVKKSLKIMHFNCKYGRQLTVIKSSWIFFQSDLPLGAGVYPTKFGVNWSHSFLRKNNREITIAK
jgi:hypothetical protein